MDYLSKSKEELASELQKVQESLQALGANMEEEKAVRAAVLFSLEEREKILKCHNQISKLLNTDDLPVSQVMEKVLEIIRGGMSFPGLAEVRIKISDKEYQTAGFEEAGSRMSAEIHVFGEKAGEVMVGYLNGVQVNANEHQVKNETELLQAIAERLGSYVLRDRYLNNLRVTEQKYKSLVESVSDVIFDLDVHGTIQYISPSIKQLLGYSQSEIIGKSFVLFVGTNAEFLSGRFALLAERGEISHEYAMVNKSGETRWIRISTKANYEDGIFKGGTGTLVDITERKLAEIALQESESLYKSVIQASPDGIAITDLEGNIRFSSPQACRIFLVDRPEEIIGRNILLFVAEQDRERARDNIANMFKGAFPGAEEYKGIRSDGSNFDIEVNGEFVRDDNGLPVSMVFVTRDISDRNSIRQKLYRSEETYTKLVETINDIIYEIGLDGIIKFVSPAITKFLGYTPDEVKGVNFINFVHADDRERLIQALKDTAEMPNSNLEYRILKKDGTMCWVHSSASPVYQEGKIVGRSGSLTNITKRKLAEQELLILSRAVEQSPVSILITNPDGAIEYANPKALESTGYTLEELKGQNPRLLKSGQTDPGEYQAMWDSISKGKSWNTIFHNRRKNGELYWESAVISPITDSDGKIIYYLSVKEDITERRKTDEALLQNENRFSQLAEQSQTVIWEVDKDGLYTYVSRVAEMVWGYSPEEVVGKNHFYDLHPEAGREYFREMAMARFARKESIIGLPNQIVTKSGEVIWVSTNGIPILGENGVLEGYRGADTDITERRRQEIELKKLSMAVKQSPAGIVIIDADTRIIFVNPAFERITGYKSDELIGLVTRTTDFGISDPILQKQMVAAIREGKEWQGEWITNRKNGERFWEDIMVTPILDENGLVVNYLIIIQDIDERKNAEREIRDLNLNLELKIAERTVQLGKINNDLLQEIEDRKLVEATLKEARIQADKASMAKSEFLSRMSHELRTPMNAILGFAQLLEMGDLSAGQKKGVNHIMKSGKHLLDLINEVLDITRIEAGRITMSIEPVQVSGVLEEMMDVFRLQAQDRQITLTIAEGPCNTGFIRSDRQRLKQILLNLINNAIKYNIPGGSVKIIAEGRSGDTEPEKRIRISVTDTGIGLAEEDLPKLFVPFERVGAEKTTTEGTGLGLAVVKRLVDAMGGKLGVESKPGKGSTFWFELPQSRNPGESFDQIKKNNTVDQPSAAKTGTVLYIEDNKSNIELVEQIIAIHRRGIRLIVSMEGLLAMDLALSNQPDLILLDLDLPDVHGSKVMELLKAHEGTREIPVVIISANAMPYQLNKLLEAGARYYLTKPLDVNDFLNVVDELI